MVKYRNWIINANKSCIWAWLDVAFKLGIPKDVRMIISEYLILPRPEDFLHWRTKRVDESMSWMK